MNEIQDPVQGVAVVTKALPTLTNLPAILMQNQASASGAIKAATTLIEECRRVPKMTAELDIKVMELIVKINATGKKMEDKRKPGTQMMAEIAKVLIGEENSLKPSITELQKFRDQRAREVVEDNRRIMEEQERIRKRNLALADGAGYFNEQIGLCLAAKLRSRKALFQQSFDEITLENIDEKEKNMRILRHDFPAAKLPEILVYKSWSHPAIDAAEVTRIEEKAKHDYNFEAYYLTYKADLEEFMRGLIDRIPTKRAQLLEVKANEERQRILRQQQEENRRKQEELDRQQREAKSEKDKKEAQGRKEAQDKENERLRLLQEAQDKENERLRLEEEQRKETERQQQQEQDRINQQKVKESSEMKKTEFIGGTLFDSVNAANLKEAEAETRKGWKITVTNVAGWAQLWQFWYMACAATTSLEKFEKTTLAQIKAYAEEKAPTEKIESSFLQYEETIKAVNRAAKKAVKPAI